MKHILVLIILSLLMATKTDAQVSEDGKEAEILHTNTGTIEYTLQGTGRTIVIVHGGNSNCFAEIKQQHLIEKGYQVLVPSRPGYGRTSIEFGHTAAEQASSIKLLMDSLHIEKAVILANSAGGPVGLEIAKLFPQQVACLILEECITKTWVSKWSPRYYGMKYMMHPKRQAKLWDKMRIEFREDRKGHLRRLCRMFSTLKPEDVLAEWGETAIHEYQISLSSSNSGEGFINDIDHKPQDIHKIKVPTLIVHSPFDKNVPFSHALYANKKIPNSELFIAPARSHLIYYGKDSELILNKRISFLEKHQW